MFQSISDKVYNSDPEGIWTKLALVISKEKEIGIEEQVYLNQQKKAFMLEFYSGISLIPLGSAWLFFRNNQKGILRLKSKSIKKGVIFSLICVTNIFFFSQYLRFFKSSDLIDSLNFKYMSKLN